MQIEIDGAPLNQQTVRGNLGLGNGNALQIDMKAMGFDRFIDAQLDCRHDHAEFAEDLFTHPFSTAAETGDRQCADKLPAHKDNHAGARWQRLDLARATFAHRASVADLADAGSRVGLAGARNLDRLGIRTFYILGSAPMDPEGRGREPSAYHQKGGRGKAWNEGESEYDRRSEA